MESWGKLGWATLPTLPVQDEPHQHTLQVIPRLNSPLLSFARNIMASYFLKSVDSEIPVVEG